VYVFKEGGEECLLDFEDHDVVHISFLIPGISMHLFGSLRHAMALVLHLLSLVPILAIFCFPEYSSSGFLIKNRSNMVCKVLVY